MHRNCRSFYYHVICIILNLLWSHQADLSGCLEGACAPSPPPCLRAWRVCACVLVGGGVGQVFPSWWKLCFLSFWPITLKKYILTLMTPRPFTETLCSVSFYYFIFYQSNMFFWIYLNLKTENYVQSFRKATSCRQLQGDDRKDYMLSLQWTEVTILLFGRLRVRGGQFDFFGGGGSCSSLKQ